MAYEMEVFHCNKGGQQVESMPDHWREQAMLGIHYKETHTPVVTWIMMFFVIQAILYGWHNQQLDFMLAYPQADVDWEVHMELPKGITIQGKYWFTNYVLLLIKNF